MGEMAVQLQADRTTLNETVVEFRARGNTQFEQLSRIGGVLQNVQASMEAKRVGLQDLMLRSVREMNAVVNDKEARMVNQTVLENNFADLQADIDAIRGTASDGPSAGGGSSHLRIPDLAGLALSVFKDKEDDFKGWRETFDVQVGSI